MSNFPGAGGSVGGGGFTLGPSQNVFAGADRTAAEAARDLYDTNNPLWIPFYNNDVNLNIRLEYFDGGDQIALYQVRNSDETVWLDNSSSTGIQGDKGESGSTSNITVEVSSTYMATITDDTIIATGTFTITLPSLSSATKKIIIKETDGTLNITGDGSETIEGATTIILTSGQSVTVAPTSTGWIIA